MAHYGGRPPELRPQGPFELCDADAGYRDLLEQVRGRDSRGRIGRERRPELRMYGCGLKASATRDASRSTLPCACRCFGSTACQKSSWSKISKQPAAS